jgi:GrpB-like predicted nucleotidyltransferase (UPF0157 family)
LGIMSLGLPAGQNFLVPHDPGWARLFDEEGTRLRSVLPSDALDIQHVGSTAVPGLRAKPIIDIAIAARHHALADTWQEPMASLGYDFPGDIGIPDHRIYGRDPGIRRFLIHVVDAGGPRWSQFIQFRDRLRADPQLAAQYEAAKTAAAARYPSGVRAQYSAAKTSFIEAVLGELSTWDAWSCGARPGNGL